MCDAGPEPPIYAPPSALHVEMGSLIGNAKFSDVEFRLQVRFFVLKETEFMFLRSKYAFRFLMLGFEVAI